MISIGGGDPSQSKPWESIDTFTNGLGIIIASTIAVLFAALDPFILLI